MGARACKWLFAALSLASASPCTAAPLRHFVYLGQDELADAEPILARPDIAGAQVVYTWRALETARGQYDFSAIEADLARVEKHGKQLFVQVQDRFFSASARNLPDYLLTDPDYGGGLARQLDNPGEGVPVAAGWVSRQWDPQVRQRFQALLAALARRFDGRILGINLPETAVGIDEKNPPEGFTCDGYFEAARENAAAARRAFLKSAVVQYINFWPCEWNDSHGYMRRFFEFAHTAGLGLGGPDIVPWRRGQMKNSYPFFNRYKGKLSIVAMAIQEPTLTYTNPRTGKPFTRAEFEAFADDYLGVNVIFWSKDSPWLAR
jgi:hypothetical protein